MNDLNRTLLSDVVNQRLNEALNNGVGTEEGKLAFEEAMKAVDREIEIQKLEEARADRAENNKAKSDEAKKDRIIRCVEIAALMVAVPIVETVCKRSYAKLVCNFEKDYTFTTTAGRALSGLFRFKK